MHKYPICTTYPTIRYKYPDIQYPSKLNVGAPFRASGLSSFCQLSLATTIGHFTIVRQKILDGFLWFPICTIQTIVPKHCSRKTHSWIISIIHVICPSFRCSEIDQSDHLPLPSIHSATVKTNRCPGCTWFMAVFIHPNRTPTDGHPPFFGMIHLLIMVPPHKNINGIPVWRDILGWYRGFLKWGYPQNPS